MTPKQKRFILYGGMYMDKLHKRTPTPEPIKRDATSIPYTAIQFGYTVPHNPEQCICKGGCKKCRTFIKECADGLHPEIPCKLPPSTGIVASKPNFVAIHDIYVEDEQGKLLHTSKCRIVKANNHKPHSYKDEVEQHKTPIIVRASPMKSAATGVKIYNKY